MPLKITAGLVGGFGPREWSKAALVEAGIAVRAGVEAATLGLKDDLRDEIASAGLGTKLGNAIGAKVYPPAGKPSLDAAGYIFPRGNKATAIFDAYNRGVTITAHNGRYLAIPTPEAGRGNRFRKATPQEFEERTGIKLHFVQLKNGNAVLVGESIVAKSGRGRRAATKKRREQGRKVQSTVFFVLIRAARLPVRLHFDAIAQKWGDRVPQLIEAAEQGDV